MPIVYTHVYIQATKTWFFTSQPNGVLRPLCQRQGQVSHTHIHWQDAEYKISPTSAATAVGYPTHMGATPGLLRGGTGDPPLARAEGSIDSGGPRQRNCCNCNRLCEHPKRAGRCRHLRE